MTKTTKEEKMGIEALLHQERRKVAEQIRYLTSDLSDDKSVSDTDRVIQVRKYIDSLLNSPTNDKER